MKLSELNPQLCTISERSMIHALRNTIGRLADSIKPEKLTMEEIDEAIKQIKELKKEQKALLAKIQKALNSKNRQL